MTIGMKAMGTKKRGKRYGEPLRLGPCSLALTSGGRSH
jgi:hypothetical protein